MTASSSPANQSNKKSPGRRLLWLGLGFGVVSLLLLAGIIAIALFVSDGSGLASTMQLIRDLFVIFLVLEMVLGGAALTILIIQIARLANLIHNEMIPVLTSSTDAVNNIRGTAEFLSQNLTEPVIQASSALAGAREVINLIRDLKSMRDIMGTASGAGNGSDGKQAETTEET